MSEEQHLSRRQLREQGKLGVRDASTPSLTTTAELRLHRPSRRELRAAEHSNEQAEKVIRQSIMGASDAPAADSADAATSAEVGLTDTGVNFRDFFSALDTTEDDAEQEAPVQKMERRSLFDRFDDEQESGEHDSSRVQDSAVSQAAGEAPESDIIHNSDQIQESDKSLDSDDSHDSDSSQGSGFIWKPESVEEEQAPAVTSSDDASATRDARLEAVNSSVLDEAGVDADEEVIDSEFAKLLNPESGTEADTRDGKSADSQEAEELAEESKESDSSEELEVGESEETEETESADDVLSSSEEDASAAGETSDKEESSQDEPADDVENSAADSTSAKHEKAEPSAHDKSTEDKNSAAAFSDESKISDTSSSDVVTIEAKKTSPVLGWLILLILIIIGALLGYLLGTWMTVTFLSAPTVLDQLAGTMLML